jgi:hypothetical protein
MPPKVLSCGSWYPIGAPFADTTFSCSDGSFSSAAPRRDASGLKGGTLSVAWAAPSQWLSSFRDESSGASEPSYEIDGRVFERI